MSVDPDGDSWTFVQVDPTAPKKRRKRRKVSPAPAQQDREAAGELQVSLPTNLLPPAPTSTYERDFGDNDTPSRGDTPVRSLEERGLARSMTDFERFLILSNENGGGQEVEMLDWTELFGENLFTPWTPMATTPIESALFDFYAMETVKASVSFDDESNPFRSALLPLAASNPSTFHAALAVAGAHWANRLRLSEKFDARGRTGQQVRLLHLASSYHRGIAQDIVEKPLNTNLSPASRQLAEEARVASRILNMTWQTFSDGYIVRSGILAEVHQVIQLSQSSNTGNVGPMGRFLRIWLSWVDTLDSAAHGRSRLTWDTELPTEEQSVVDHALQRTVGCTPETLRLIAQVSSLATSTSFLDLEAVKQHSTQSSELDTEILQTLTGRIEEDESSTSARAFNLALYLYYLTSIPRSSLNHPSISWAVNQLLNLLSYAESHNYRQAWATWPYFILGLHVTTPRHRRRVLDRFTWLATTLSIGNLSTLSTCLETLWERRDRGEETTWQEISVSLGGAIVTPL